MCHFKPLTGWNPCKFAFVAAFQVLLCLVGFSATWWQISFFGEGCPDGNDINYYISFEDGLCYSGEYGLSGFNGPSSFTSCNSWESLADNNGSDDVITNNDHNAPNLYLKCRHLLIAAMVLAIFFTLSFLIKDGVSEDLSMPSDTSRTTPPVDDIENNGNKGTVEPVGLVGDSYGPMDSSETGTATGTATDRLSSSSVSTVVSSTPQSMVEPSKRRAKTPYELAYEAENHLLFAEYWHRWQYIRCFQLFLGFLVAFCIFVAFMAALSTVFYRLPRNYGLYYTDCQHATSLPSFGWAAAFCSFFLTVSELYVLGNGNTIWSDEQSKSNTCGCFGCCCNRDTQPDTASKSGLRNRPSSGAEMTADVPRVELDSRKPYVTASLYGGTEATQNTIKPPAGIALPSIPEPATVRNPMDISVSVSAGYGAGTARGTTGTVHSPTHQHAMSEVDTRAWEERRSLEYDGTIPSSNTRTNEQVSNSSSCVSASVISPFADEESEPTEPVKPMSVYSNPFD